MIKKDDIEILLVEDNAGDARLITELLTGEGCSACRINKVDRLSAALDLLDDNDVDIILLDLFMPDSQGLDTLIRVLEKVPERPVIVFTGMADEATALSAVQAGAQDYLVKGQINGKLLIKSIRYSIERKHALSVLKHYSRQVEQSEKFIKNIFEAMNEAINVLSTDFRIISANRAYAELAGVPMEEILGKHCHEVFHHSEKPCHMIGKDCPVMYVFETGKSHTAAHSRYNEKGELTHMEIKFYPVRDNDGKLTSVIESIHDVTEEKRLEEQLRHSQRVEAVGRLAGGIAHDFNNILSAITNYAYFMKMEMEEDNPLKSYVEHILTSADRAAVLIRGLLTFSRKQPINIMPVNPNEIIIRMAHLFSRVLGEDVELTTILSDTSMSTMADSGQLEQVLMNLATNAKDAMPHGGKLLIKTGIEVMDNAFMETYGYGTPGKYVSICVTDTGTGMDETIKEKAFEPFFTTKDIGKGTGLGLSIVYGIVKQHNGYINLTSEPGQGTTCRIYLPAIEADVPACEAEVSASLPSDTRNATILIAEDEAEVREVLQELLEEFGYTVITAANGDEAVEKFMAHKGSVDMLILDLIMPKKTGSAAYAEIAKIKPGIRMLFMSGYPEEVIVENGLTPNATNFIVKPVSPMDVLKKVREVLGK